MMFGAGQSKERIKRRGQSLTTKLVHVSHENTTFCDYICIICTENVISKTMRQIMN